MGITCPKCGVKLKLKTQPPAGKRIKCPKCAAAFEPVEEVQEVEEVEDAPAEEEPDERPGRKRRPQDDDEEEAERDAEEERPRRRKKAKKRQGGSGVLLWSLIGGGIALVVAALVVVLIMVGGRGGAYGQHEQAMNDTLQILSDLVSALESVKDQDSARTAAARIEQACDRMEAMGPRAKALPKITPAEQQQLQAKLKPRLDELQGRMQRVALQAGLHGRNEPAFMAAIQRLTRVGHTLKGLGV